MVPPGVDVVGAQDAEDFVAIFEIGFVARRAQGGGRGRGDRLEIVDRFVAEVDAAAVLVNASTRFIDGEELGLGAEVGISTQKLHARGPMGVRELTSVKWVVRGDGQVRR